MDKVWGWGTAVWLSIVALHSVSFQSLEITIRPHWREIYQSFQNANCNFNPLPQMWKPTTFSNLPLKFKNQKRPKYPRAWNSPAIKETDKIKNVLTEKIVTAHSALPADWKHAPLKQRLLSDALHPRVIWREQACPSQSFRVRLVPKIGNICFVTLAKILWKFSSTQHRTMITYGPIVRDPRVLTFPFVFFLT